MSKLPYTARNLEKKGSRSASSCFRRNLKQYATARNASPIVLAATGACKGESSAGLKGESSASLKGESQGRVSRVSQG